MGFRFRRSIRIAPGLRVNFGKKGVSLSAGVRGATFTAGSRGVYSNVGIPGTGISYRQRLDSPSYKRQVAREQRLLERSAKYLEEATPQKQTIGVEIILSDDGNIRMQTSSGEPLSKSQLKLVWEQQSEVVVNWLKNEAEKINGDVDLLTSIHEDTPPIDTEPEYQSIPFTEEQPKYPAPVQESPKPTLKTIPELGFFSKLFEKNRLAHIHKMEQFEEEYKKEIGSWEKSEKAMKDKYQSLIDDFQRKNSEWEDKKKAHEASELLNKENFPELLRTEQNTMDKILELALNSLSWPRETTVSYQIMDNGKNIWLDVDLPELEDLPKRVASLAATGRKLNIKDKPQKQLNEEYALHIHGIAFRIAGTVFATLPTSEMAMISGYTQRLDIATGKTNDDYIYSIKIDRDRYSEMNFDAIDKINPIEAMGIFEIQRKMTSTFIFKAIEPYQPE